jgi:hypothetical protein
MPKSKPTVVDNSGGLTPGQRLARKLCLWGVTVAVGVTALGIGFGRLKKHVETRYATPAQPPVVVLKDRPVWMNEFLAQRIATVARPNLAQSAFDQSMLREVHDQLLSDPDVSRWIEKIHTVRRVYGSAPGDTVEISATYRVPAALVRHQGDFWLVDSRGIQLEQIPSDLVPRVVLGRDGKLVIRVVDGVAKRPPEPGRVASEDLSAGLELLRLIHDQPFAQEIVKVDVSNYSGRRDSAAAHLVLVTRYNTEIRWGRPVNTKHNFGEVDDRRKLMYLERIAAEFGQVDARRPWIDVRFDRPIYPKPVSPVGDPEGASVASDSR